MLIYYSSVRVRDLSVSSMWRYVTAKNIMSWEMRRVGARMSQLSQKLNEKKNEKKREAREREREREVR